MKRSSANPIKTMGGIDFYVTSQDQFAAERYICYNSDPVAPHFTITGIAEIEFRYHTINSGRNIHQTRPSYTSEKRLFKFKGPMPFKFKLKY
jgi:hypothetical protein